MLPASCEAEPSASPAFAATSTTPGCRQRPGRCSDRAGACACGGWVQWQADSGRTGEAGCCAADVEGSIGAAEAAEAACPTAQSGASCACVRILNGAHIGRERAAARARGFPAGRAGRRTMAWLPPASVAPSRAAGAAAVAGSTAPVRWGCDNCGGNGPLAAGRYQSRLELQPMRPPQHA